jgi:uncharacterized integral membrane protein
MKKAKIILIAVISLLALIIFLQNTQTVETRILFMKVSMSRALLLILTFLMGFAAGIVTTTYIMRKPAAAEKSQKAQTP